MKFRVGYIAVAAVAAMASSSVATGQVFNGGMPLGFTCIGSCGVSGADGMVPLAPLGGTQFGWISTLGGLTMDPLGIGGTTNGTIMTSSPFTAILGQTLSFRFNYVTSDGGPFNDYAYVRLVGSGGPLMLFTARTEPGGNTVPGQGLPGIAPGVTLTPASTVVVAGAPTFSPLGSWTDTCYDVGCGYTGWIRAAYTIPTAGSYQLEFGVFNLLDEVWDSSLAVDYALGAGETPQVPDIEDPTTVPEPSTWMMMASGLALLGAVARRKRTTLMAT